MRFIFYRLTAHVKNFLEYLSCQRPNIKFTFEVEENDTISFLDSKITKKNNSFSTSIYHRPTFSCSIFNFVPKFYNFVV